MLDRVEIELSNYKRLLKEINASIKTMVASGKFTPADIKEKKETAVMYKQFIKKCDQDIAMITSEMERIGEPKKIGRPSIGKARTVKITLPEEDWKHIDQLVASKRVNSNAEYFRSLHDSSLNDFLIVE